MIAPDRLKEIHALCDEITPAPWFNDGKTIWCFIDGGYEYTDIATIIATIGEGDRENPSEIEFNARFIAQSRQIIPELLDEIERLRSEPVHYSNNTDKLKGLEKAAMAVLSNLMIRTNATKATFKIGNDKDGDFEFECTWTKANAPERF